MNPKTPQICVFLESSTRALGFGGLRAVHGLARLALDLEAPGFLGVFQETGYDGLGSVGEMVFGLRALGDC